MNENNSIPALTGQNALQEIVLDAIFQMISNAVSNSEKVSKEKYEAGLKLIETDADMSTQEKLDAMDKNYNRWNQEHWQNVLTLAVGLLGVAVVRSAAVKTMPRY